MHFFKVILPQHIEDKRMEIPKEFLNKFGKKLSDTAIIKLPSGPIIWSIGLTKKGGVISFEHGWPEFIDFFSISVGHMLVFRYDGNSSFHVLIFSLLATEIDYAKYYFRTSNFKDKTQVIELDSSSTHSDDETSSTQSESSWSSREHGQVNLKTEPMYANTGTTRRSSFNTSLESQSKERALAEAEAFKSKNPFFRAIMHPSCARRGGNM
ncbi:hypothetical protein MKW94_003212, partial [Papaver nudicaule]|nr:hypothetical protein [Papaver nudicaule]